MLTAAAFAQPADAVPPGGFSDGKTAAPSALIVPHASKADQSLLLEALTKVSRDTDHWAYQETSVTTDKNGKSKGATVVAVDPSKPYPEQYTPLLISGKPPTEKQLKEYRRKGEKRGERLERPEGLGGQTPKPASTGQKLGELVDLDHATVVDETDQIVTYEVPLRKDNNQRFPPEKFQVRARVNKATRSIENVAVLLREPLRTKLILKIKSGTASLDFATVDAKYPPQLTSIEGDASASILFVSVGGGFDLKRTDYRRVKPYGDKFDVQIGPLKALDF